MISYELARKLKDAGFPWKKDWKGEVLSDESAPEGEEPMTAYAPTLSELIEACGDGFHELHWCAIGKFNNPKRWSVWGYNRDLGEFIGPTPEEAVAKLWLELKNENS